MQLRNIYVRFFRSFNFDYLRQDSEGVGQFPWDLTADGKFYPFIRVELERDVTTIVGANESGKSQLILAIQCLLGDEPVSPRAFCRYSEFFSVRGKMPLPEFGGQFSKFNELERATISQTLGEPFTGEHLWYFRQSGQEVVYVQSGEEWVARVVSDGANALRLPIARRMDADTVLPASISLYDLTREIDSPDPRGRTGWYRAFKNLKLNEQQFQIPGNSIQPLDAIAARNAKDELKAKESFELARALLEKVANIDPQAYSQLLDSEVNDDAYAAALTSNMTSLLRESLNFKKWWSQDADFALELQKDAFHLVLTLRDKTGQTYTFDERSGGMKHFLSYFIQRLAYTPKVAGRGEIILADEPDAFLSAQGQQDLLAVFESYAYPSEPDQLPAQVLYVTHSPFLIDRNRPERIRVLQKGLSEEGTRVVPKAAVDRYEPLRTAFNSFHADTVFIGNSNLLVEGPADQILFSSVSAAMSASDKMWNTLNLNRLTMVPVHGATQYRYMLHLTRSGGLDRPSVVALLDSDPAGVAAGKDLQNGFGSAPIIDPRFIVSIGSVPTTNLKLAVAEVQEPEDLIPLPLALLALDSVVDDICIPTDAKEIKGKLNSRPSSIAKKARLFDTLKTWLAEDSSELERPIELTKINFARAVARVLAENDVDADIETELFRNFDALFSILNDATDAASRENSEEMTTQATKRLVERFKRDHKTSANGRSVIYLLDSIRGSLSGVTQEDERIRAVARELDIEYGLSAAPLEFVERFDSLRSRLSELVWGHGARL